MATLLLELSFTRIFSVVLFYHFAFMAVSVALFGLGTGAIFSYWMTSRGFLKGWGQLGKLSLWNVGVTFAILLILLQQNFSPQVTRRNAMELAFIYFITAIPFFFGGIVISVAIERTIERVHQIYFFDLLGAGVGCLLLVPLLNLAGGPNTVLAAAAIYGLAGLFWYSADGSPRPARAALVLAAAVGVFALLNSFGGWVDVRFAKGMRLSQELFSRWNSFSRVAVRTEYGELFIRIDADAATGISNFSPEDSNPGLLQRLQTGGPYLPYRIRPGAKTLVIGPGGGFDVARSLASGSRNITGVEINPIIVDNIMKGRFADASRRLYLRPEVQIHIEDGRSYVRRSQDKYQVIQMTLVDTWASTAAGAFALSENNLYTVEAFVDYLDHLSPDGVLTITRWEFRPPRESLRVVSLGIEALRRLGVSDPRLHFLISQDGVGQAYGAQATVLIKRTPFTAGEIALARSAMTEGGSQATYVPGGEASNPFTDLLQSSDPVGFESKYQYDIEPVTDNRPFFFYTVRPRDLWAFVTSAHTEDVKVNIGVMTLFVLLGASITATAVIMLLPPLLLGAQVPREKAAFVHLGYFFAVGIGFIMIEVGLIQQFVLFLGRPTYSLTVVVFSLLIASGLGSYASASVIGEHERRLRNLLVAIALAVSALGLLLQPILAAGVGLPLAAKCLLSTILLFPAGFVMGMAFPCGLKRLERSYPTAVRWAWAVNSASSVLGSVAAIFFAIHLGLLQTLLLGASAYLLALTAIILTASTTRSRISSVKAH